MFAVSLFSELQTSWNFTLKYIIMSPKIRDRIQPKITQQKNKKQTKKITQHTLLTRFSVSFLSIPRTKTKFFFLTFHDIETFYIFDSRPVSP